MWLRWPIHLFRCQDFWWKHANKVSPLLIQTTYLPHAVSYLAIWEKTITKHVEVLIINLSFYAIHVPFSKPINRQKTWSEVIIEFSQNNLSHKFKTFSQNFELQFWKQCQVILKNQFIYPLYGYVIRYLIYVRESTILKYYTTEIIPFVIR